MSGPTLIPRSISLPLRSKPDSASASLVAMSQVVRSFL